MLSAAALGAVVVLALAGRDTRTITTIVPTTITTPRTVAAHAPPRQRHVPARPADGTFWRLIADTRGASGNDTAERTRQQLDRQAYRWDLWGAPT